MDINKKHGILEEYFVNINQLSFNKAKELIDKENEENSKAPILWTSFLNLLGILATSEKNTYALNFLLAFNSRKLFWRKDTLMNTYGTLLSELVKMQMAFCEANYEKGNLEIFIMSLANQLQQLIQLRINNITFYQQLFSQNSGHHLIISQMVNNNQESLKILNEVTFHILLMPYKSLLNNECECINHLLKADIAIQKCNYLESLLKLLLASSKINTWQSMRQSNENRTLPLLSSKTLSFELIEWISKYKLLLLAKFNLYFYNTLSLQSNQNEVKSLLSNNPFDFCKGINKIYRKLDAYIILFLFNPVANIKAEFLYSLPNLLVKDNNCCFYSYPSDKLEKYLQVVLNHFQEKLSELKSSEKAIISIDDRLYLFLHAIDEYSTIALILHKKTKLDASNLSIITNFLSDLKCNKLHLLFKPK